MRLRRFGGPAAIGEVVQQVELDVRCAGIRLSASDCMSLRACEVARGLAQRRERRAPATRVSLRASSALPLPSAGSRAGAGRAARPVRGCGQRRMRTAAAPRQLRWSMLVSVTREPRRRSRLTTVRCRPWRR